MISFDVKIDDQASGRSAAVAAAYAAKRHLPIIAHSAANVVKDHFTKLDKQRHRGYTNFGFYARAAAATSGTVRKGSAAVLIDHEGIALRVFGKRGMKPRTAKYFTIPVAASSYGKRVEEFGDTVEWIINRRTQTGVVTLGGRVIYALTTVINQPEDRTVLPTDKDVAKQVIDDLNVWTDLQESRG